MSALLISLTLILSQNGDTGDGAPAPQRKAEDVVLRWNAVARKAAADAKSPPPVIARNLAMMHVAMADAINPVYQEFRPYHVRLRATEDIDPECAAACAAAKILSAAYPKRADEFEKLRKAEVDARKAGKPRDLGVTLGESVAARILALRRNDGSADAARYDRAPAAGVWKPTPPNRAAALLPGWGGVTPFGVKDRKAFKVPPPPSLTSREFADDYDEVRLLGSEKSRTRTVDQTIIAWFWDDGPGTSTPVGHWNMIAREVSLDKGLTVSENARLFALLNVAMADAAILCWECKYRDALWRPVTAIREAASMKNPDAKPEAGWDSLLVTPPFPSYTSGHSTFSGAAARTLALALGEDKIRFKVGSEGYVGMEREYESFSQAADEAGRSRIYGGIHYQCDNTAGLALGRAIADEVVKTRMARDEAAVRRKAGRPAQTVPVQRERP